MNVIKPFQHSPAGVAILQQVRPMFSPDTAPDDLSVSRTAGLEAMDRLEQVGSEDEKLVASLTRQVAARANDGVSMACLCKAVAELADNVAVRSAGAPGLSVTLGQVLAEIGSSAHEMWTGDSDTRPGLERRNEVHDTFLRAIAEHASMPGERLVAKTGLAAAQGSDDHGRYYVGGETLEQLSQWNSPTMANEFTLGSIAWRTHHGTDTFLEAIGQHARNPQIGEQARRLATGDLESDDVARFFISLRDQART